MKQMAASDRQRLNFRHAPIAAMAKNLAEPKLGCQRFWRNVAAKSQSDLQQLGELRASVLASSKIAFFGQKLKDTSGIY